MSKKELPLRGFDVGLFYKTAIWTFVGGLIFFLIVFIAIGYLAH
ncbi:MAG TPA: hypothetical protein VK158_06015 [Acidobacteriota bacterium]|nr:hypothetical protein [Acidobacteriota bacterium]